MQGQVEEERAEGVGAELEPVEAGVSRLEGEREALELKWKSIKAQMEMKTEELAEKRRELEAGRAELAKVKELLNEPQLELEMLLK